MYDQRKDQNSPERAQQKNCPKRVETLNVPTDDMENSNDNN